MRACAKQNRHHKALTFETRRCCPGASVEAGGRAGRAQATLAWTGAGTSSRRSNLRNWDRLRVPADGEFALFSGSLPFATSLVDLSLNLHSLVCASNAQPFAVHVSGAPAPARAVGSTSAVFRRRASPSGPSKEAASSASGASGW